MTYDPHKVAFIDTETLGLDPDWDQIWEIAVIVDGAEHVWQQGIPQWGDLAAKPIDPWVLENTGILGRYDHSTAIAHTDSIERFINLTSGRHLVGACPWFDSERLHAQQRWHNGTHRVNGSKFDFGRMMLWHYHLIDIETLVIGYMRGQYSDVADTEGPTKYDLPWDSADLSRFVGINPDDYLPKHSALTDARWAKAVFEAVMGDPL